MSSSRREEGMSSLYLRESSSPRRLSLGRLALEDEGTSSLRNIRNRSPVTLMTQLNIPQHLNLLQCEDLKYHAVEVHSDELSLDTLL